jgi:hypothetical protein
MSRESAIEAAAQATGGTEFAQRLAEYLVDIVAPHLAGEALRGLAEDPQVIEACASEAFWTDDIGGHHKPGRVPHTWENIPEEGRENYRTLVRAVLRRAALVLADT